MASSSSSIVIRIPSQTNDGEIAAATAGTVPATPKDSDDSVPRAPPAATATDKVMSTAANLAQLLPTGTVLAYQALSPSFTNHGKCETSNQWLTAALVIVLTASCLFFAFTDSVLGRDKKLYYGVATWGGFNVFNFSSEEEKKEWGAEEFRRLRLRPLDFIHSFFTAVVFLTVAFSDVGLQNCFFPDASKNTEELLKNLPLGMAVLSSFVFIIFPTKRKSIGYNDTTPRRKVWRCIVGSVKCWRLIFKTLQWDPILDELQPRSQVTKRMAGQGTSTTPTSTLEAPLIPHVRSNS